MTFLDKHSGLFTDHYEMVMAQGYYQSGMANIPVCFDYFFRKNPFGGGYTVFAGLDDLLDSLEKLRFDTTDLQFLKSIGFDQEFVDSLENFHFSGQIFSMKEGEIVFPNEPVLRIEGSLLEAQLVETIVLNILNFESLIATKASRIRFAAGDKALMDFGLRRAQGLGGVHASKAAIIGGFEQTSNMYSAYQFGLSSSGTMAHSWIQNFDDELSAFQTFADHFPDHCILLVDTYDTLRSGIPNAIIIAKDLEMKGHHLTGIRLDSGDLAYLSRKARKMLDDAGLNYVKIVVSNQLDEHVIRSLEHQNAPIDIYGVGTALITGKSDAALDGVYKLSMSDHKPSMKFSENEAKETLPGSKWVERFYDDEGQFNLDGISLVSEENAEIFYHPYKPEKNTNTSLLKREKLHHEVMHHGKRTGPFEQTILSDIVHYHKERFDLLPKEYKRFENAHLYRVGVSESLMKLKDKLKKNH